MSQSALVGVGLYSIPDAARIIGLKPAILRRWVSEYTYTSHGVTYRHRQVVPPHLSGTKGVLTFLEIIELLFVKQFRAEGVSRQVIRKAAQAAARKFDTPYPFAVRRFDTDERSIFETLKAQPDGEASVEDLARGQYVFDIVVRPFFRKLDYSGSGAALKFWPLDREAYSAAKVRCLLGWRPRDNLAHLRARRPTWEHDLPNAQPRQRCRTSERAVAMKRFKPSDATVRVADTGTCLLVRWDAASADTYQYLRASFGTTFPRRGEATWRRDEGGWAIPYRYHKRLNKWIARTFEPDAVTWVQEPRQSEAGSRAEDAVPRPDTAVDLLAAYDLLHLLPTAPPELVTAAYRCAARLHHPDRGGDDEMMARLNAAVACIRAHQAGA